MQEQQALVNEKLIDKELGEKLLNLGNELNGDALLLRGYELPPELPRNKSLS